VFKPEKWMKKIRPHGCVVCIVTEAENKVTQGGIHLPDNVQAGAGHGIGRVFAVGPGEHHPINGFTEPATMVGQAVVWIKNERIQELSFEGHKYYAVDDKDILLHVAEESDEA
jgi:co-chaperonin GroES (HSP10)